MAMFEVTIVGTVKISRTVMVKANNARDAEDAAFFQMMWSEEDHEWEAASLFDGQKKISAGAVTGEFCGDCEQVPMKRKRTK